MLLQNIIYYYKMLLHLQTDWLERATANTRA